MYAGQLRTAVRSLQLDACGGADYGTSTRMSVGRALSGANSK